MLFRVIMTYAALVLMTAASVHHFGTLEGLGLAAGVWLLMPWTKL